MQLNLEPRPNLVDSPWQFTERRSGCRSPQWRPRDTRAAFEESGRSLLLAGSAGSGKTMQLLELARSLVGRARADASAALPVVLNLSSWSLRREELIHWIASELCEKYGVRPKLAREWIERDHVVLLLDGFDEVEAGARAACLDAINRFLRQHPLPIVVASRLQEYEHAGARLRLHATVCISELDDDHILGYLQGLGTHHRGMIDALAARPELRALARTPLMLGIMAAAVEGCPALDSEQGTDAMFEAYLRTVFERRRRVEPWHATATLAYLGALGRGMQRDAQSELRIESIQAGLLESRRLRALFMILVFATTAVIYFGLNIATNVALDGLEAGLMTGVTLSTASLPVVFYFAGIARVRPVQALGWSWREVIGNLPRCLVLGVLSGCAFGVVFDYLGGILLGIMGALLVSLCTGWSRVDVDPRRGGHEGVWRSAKNALAVFVPVALLSGIFHTWIVVWVIERYIGDPATLGIVPGWSVFWGMSMFYGLMLALIRGGVTVIQHFWLRVLATRAGIIPWQLRGLLEYACDRALMRRVGGGYIFIHRTLLEYLARRPRHGLD